MNSKLAAFKRQSGKQPETAAKDTKLLDRQDAPVAKPNQHAQSISAHTDMRYQRPGKERRYTTSITITTTHHAKVKAMAYKEDRAVSDIFEEAIELIWKKRPADAYLERR